MYARFAQTRGQMEHKLRLTARGHAVCELMVDQGLTLEDACERVDLELRTLRDTVDEIVAQRSWEEVPLAMQAALDAVSQHVQSAYLEEQRAASHIGVAATA
jgi:hypothetical protein